MFRSFKDQDFVEIAFLAIITTEQVKGYGTRLMNKLKNYLQSQDKKFILTYADNNAIGYFKKQGFTNSPRKPAKEWRGYIKDYDGGTVMECYIHDKIDYNNLYQDIKKQKEAVLEAVRSLYHIKVYQGLDFSKAEFIDNNQKKGKKIPFEKIPGLKEAGWNLELYKKSILESENISFYKQCDNILKKISSEPNSWPFKNPVDKDEVPDYYKVISNPMDLKTIREKLESYKYYYSKDEFKEDILLIIKNAKTYNKPNTIYFKYATEIEKIITPYLEKMCDPTQVEIDEFREKAKQFEGLKTEEVKEMKDIKNENN